MTPRSLGALAGALILLASGGPMMAQTPTSLSVRDATGANAEPLRDDGRDGLADAVSGERRGQRDEAGRADHPAPGHRGRHQAGDELRRGDDRHVVRARPRYRRGLFGRRERGASGLGRVSDHRARGRGLQPVRLRRRPGRLRDGHLHFTALR